MRAITIGAYGGPDVVVRLRRDARRCPSRGPGGATDVQVVCAGVNLHGHPYPPGQVRRSRVPIRVRILRARWAWKAPGWSWPPGPGVAHPAVGQRVAWCIAWGSFAEYAAIPARLAAVIPDAIAFDTAASAMFQGCTAHYLVHDVARLQPGATCLVHAASGSIGQILIQMARRMGASVYATASTADKRAVALRRGADAALPYADGGFRGRRCAN